MESSVLEILILPQTRGGAEIGTMAGHCDRSEKGFGVFDITAYRQQRFAYTGPRAYYCLRNNLFFHCG